MAQEVLAVRLDDGDEHVTRNWSWESPPGPAYTTDGMFLRRDPSGTRIWTVLLDGFVGKVGGEYAAHITVHEQETVGTAVVHAQEVGPGGARWTTLEVLQRFDGERWVPAS